MLCDVLLFVILYPLMKSHTHIVCSLDMFVWKNVEKEFSNPYA